MTVLIQGAGIAGLALAREFTKAGIDWLLVERASEIRPIGTGITLASNALTALSSTLDLDRLFRRGMPLAGINVYAHDDHPGAATPERVAGTAAFGRATASMHDRSARRRGGATIRRPRSCQPLTQGSDCRKPSVRKSTETTSAWNNEALTPSGR